jgi:hypothetical protein
MVPLSFLLTLFSAPSWSWASIDGPIYPWARLWPQSKITLTLVNVVAAQTAPLARDEFGQVANCHIDLSGKLFPIPDVNGILEHMWDVTSFSPRCFGLDVWGGLPYLTNQN